MTGDQADMLGRIKGLLPPWFGNDETPILDAVLSGPANLFAFVYSLIQYVRLQVRLGTATDGFLDLAAFDYFGSALPRSSGEADTAYRTRIKGAFWPARNTRPALTAALTTLGVSFTLLEPWNPGDTQAWGGQGGYGVAGYWGSRTTPFQCFLIVHLISSGVTQAQVYAAVEAVRPVAVTIWTRFA